MKTQYVTKDLSDILGISSKTVICWASKGWVPFDRFTVKQSAMKNPYIFPTKSALLMATICELKSTGFTPTKLEKKRLNVGKAQVSMLQLLQKVFEADLEDIKKTKLIISPDGSVLAARDVVASTYTKKPAELISIRKIIEEFELKEKNLDY